MAPLHVATLTIPRELPKTARTIISFIIPSLAKQEGGLMKSWLGLVNERNGLVRKTSELSLRMKELELEDRQYEIDKKLSALSNVPGKH